MSKADPFDLQRFIDAQAPVVDQVMQELRAGAKRSHWMWFVFPQLQGLGHSAMAKRYAITGAAEAEAYLQHEVLGQRLEECVTTLLQHTGKSVLQILGHPDDLKLRSSLTLFASLRPGESVFQQALDQFFEGEPDARSVALLLDA